MGNVGHTNATQNLISQKNCAKSQNREIIRGDPSHIIVERRRIAVQKGCKIAKSPPSLTTTFVKGNTISKHSPQFRSENVGEEQKHIGKLFL